MPEPAYVQRRIHQIDGTSEPSVLDRWFSQEEDCAEKNTSARSDDKGGLKVNVSTVGRLHECGYFENGTHPDPELIIEKPSPESVYIALAGTALSLLDDMTIATLRHSIRQLSRRNRLHPGGKRYLPSRSQIMEPTYIRDEDLGMIAVDCPCAGSYWIVNVAEAINAHRNEADIFHQIQMAWIDLRSMYKAEDGVRYQAEEVERMWNSERVTKEGIAFLNSWETILLNAKMLPPTINPAYPIMIQPHLLLSITLHPGLPRIQVSAMPDLAILNGYCTGIDLKRSASKEASMKAQSNYAEAIFTQHALAGLAQRGFAEVVLSPNMRAANNGVINLRTIELDDINQYLATVYLKGTTPEDTKQTFINYKIAGLQDGNCAEEQFVHYAMQLLEAADLVRALQSKPLRRQRSAWRTPTLRAPDGWGHPITGWDIREEEKMRNHWN